MRPNPFERFQRPRGLQGAELEQRLRLFNACRREHPEDNPQEIWELAEQVVREEADAPPPVQAPEWARTQYSKVRYQRETPLDRVHLPPLEKVFLPATEAGVTQYVKTAPTY